MYLFYHPRSWGPCGNEFPVFIIIIIITISRIIRDCSTTFMLNHSFKVSPSARCVSAASAICKDIGIFNKDYISLTDIL
jgi:hypothetical protein